MALFLENRSIGNTLHVFIVIFFCENEYCVFLVSLRTVCRGAVQQCILIVTTDRLQL